MKSPIEHHLYFSKHERQGLILLIVLIVLLITGMFVINRMGNEEAIIRITTYLPDKEDKVKSDEAGNKSLFNFDPNTLSEDSMIMLDLPEKVARNMIKYRNRGGKFKSSTDLEKIYGMQPHFKKIEPYIRIEKANEQNDHFVSNDEYKVAYTTSEDRLTVRKSSVDIQSDNSLDTTTRNKLSKKIVNEELDTTQFFAFDQIDEVIEPIELNSSSMYELMMINGIGEYYAVKIIEYRDKVGGYYNVEQLKYVIRRKESFEKVKDQVKVNPRLIRRRNINTISKDTLALLPLMSYRKAEIALRYKENHFPLKSMEDFHKMRIFKEEEINALAHYLTFN